MALQSQQLADIESIEHIVDKLAAYSYAAEGPFSLVDQIVELTPPLARVTHGLGIPVNGITNCTIVEYTAGDRSGETKWNELDMLDIFKHMKATKFRSNGSNEVRVTGESTVPMLRILRSFFQVLEPEYVFDLRDPTLEGKEPIVMLGRYFNHVVPPNTTKNDYYHLLKFGTFNPPNHHELIAQIASKAGSATLHAWQHREQLER